MIALAKLEQHFKINDCLIPERFKWYLESMKFLTFKTVLNMLQYSCSSFQCRTERKTQSHQEIVDTKISLLFDNSLLATVFAQKIPDETIRTLYGLFFTKFGVYATESQNNVVYYGINPSIGRKRFHKNTMDLSSDENEHFPAQFNHVKILCSKCKHILKFSRHTFKQLIWAI
ncbi:hypothetical protein RF11_15574 [Thelohanellus kitauei]|uniref:Uncharacterized protein n=1 Tax=Thelohanellus kitauei TaxID=669202 RepID=A0A0C2IWS6_THEKT|nr:hypothetical protein RF11_15574 [Thelohanellus kitauei]